jgi:DNA invertase Pin-like site-specific DNA recombinase
LRKALCGPEKLYEALLQGGLVFHMFGALAEFERSLIQERPQTVSLSIA